MWVFNGKAVIAILLGVGLGVGLGMWPVTQAFAGFAAIVAAMLIDVWMRLHSEDHDRPMIHPNAGGHIWFAPLWVVGIILFIVIGLVEFRVV